VIRVTLNGEPRELPEGSTLADALAAAGAPAAARGYALVLDGAVVPRSSWSQTAVAPGARIEVVVAVAGG
jgi:sulfur carrier protein